MLAVLAVLGIALVALGTLTFTCWRPPVGTGVLALGVSCLITVREVRP